MRSFRYLFKQTHIFLIALQKTSQLFFPAATARATLVVRMRSIRHAQPGDCFVSYNDTNVSY